MCAEPGKLTPSWLEVEPRSVPVPGVRTTRPFGRNSSPAPWAAFSPRWESRPRLSIGFHTNIALVREPFAGLPLVQLEIIAQLPWVIAAPEPA
jgi:hypothetical protein